MTDGLLRSIATTDLCEILVYCGQLEQHQQKLGIPATTPLIRFNIAMYQLAGGFLWRGTHCEDESFASALIHALAVMHRLDMCPEKFLPRDIVDVPRTPTNWQLLLFRSARAIQHLLYCQQSGKTERSKRFDRCQLEGDLGMFCLECVKSIPTLRRISAIDAATEILARRI